MLQQYLKKNGGNNLFQYNNVGPVCVSVLYLKSVILI